MAVMGSLHTGQAGPPWIRGAVTLNNHCSRAGHVILHTQLPSHLSGGSISPTLQAPSEHASPPGLSASPACIPPMDVNTARSLPSGSPGPQFQCCVSLCWFGICTWMGQTHLTLHVPTTPSV